MIRTVLVPLARTVVGGQRARYLGVVEEYGRATRPALRPHPPGSRSARKHLVIFCSDNGPEAGAGSAGGLRGAKTWLYEGGIRSPLVVWGPGLMAPESAGTTNDESSFARST